MKAFAKLFEKETACDKVTRFGLIDVDTAERVVVRYNIAALPVLQDDGQTLKIFIGTRKK